jgi:hypothetical protein
MGMDEGEIWTVKLLVVDKRGFVSTAMIQQTMNLLVFGDGSNNEA